MQRRTTARLRRQRARQGASLALRTTIQGLAQIGKLPAFTWLGLTAMLILAGGGWLGASARLVYGAAAASNRPIALGRASPPKAVPDVLRWDDPSDRTSYAVRLVESRTQIPGAFAFALPSGDAIQGTVPLQAQADGTSIQQANSASGTCTNGILVTAQLKSPAAIPYPISKVNNTPKTYGSPVVFALTARIGPQGLAAYAGMSYASASDTAGVSRVCGAGPFDFQMLAGCTALVCTDPLSTAGPSVGKHNDAVVHASAANTADGWKAVYALSAQSVKGQYSDSGFANAVMAQQRSKGKITHISPIASSPAIQYDAAGQAYFSVTQSVTVDRDGTTTTQQIASYFVLEGGQWLFWFSA